MRPEIKIFSGNQDQVEFGVNQWLRANPDRKVVDIKETFLGSGSRITLLHEPALPETKTRSFCNIYRWKNFEDLENKLNALFAVVPEAEVLQVIPLMAPAMMKEKQDRNAYEMEGATMVIYRNEVKP